MRTINKQFDLVRSCPLRAATALNPRVDQGWWRPGDGRHRRLGQRVLIDKSRTRASPMRRVGPEHRRQASTDRRNRARDLSRRERTADRLGQFPG